MSEGKHDNEYWEHHAKEQLLRCKGNFGCPVAYYPLASIIGYGLECECVEGVSSIFSTTPPPPLDSRKPAKGGVL